ncbi:dihydrofolate reductase family protein [Zavarzinia compransoris]|uniref:Deaminase n=1 Tax=Zavarzinia compransoris TaxID=1264899 RepID=A0A317E9X5_9PROT|nr:dihydrofolate reductase family protein [Zavarzinia compransoris]PWR23046.1 deaminase [Zavarzinia compransoris]TDP46409.1 dihydrofolate reductase [Zavarzinia compransoris]
MPRPRVSVYIAASLDGFIARADGGIEWLSVVEDEHGEDYGFGEFIADVDTVVMGRNTFDMVAGFEPWPFADKRVVVLSHRPLEDAPAGVARHDGALADLILALGEEGVRRVYLDGGESIRQGLAEDLVDDLTLSHIPVMLGRGRPLFGPEVPHGRWQLLGARHFPTGLVQATYRRLE